MRSANSASAAWHMVGGLAAALVLGGGLVKVTAVIGVLHCAAICRVNNWWQAALLGCWC